MIKKITQKKKIKLKFKQSIEDVGNTDGNIMARVASPN